MPELTFLLCAVRWMISQDENYVENRAKFQLWKQILKLSYHMTAEATIYNLSTRQIMRPLAKLIAYPIGGFNAWRRKPEVLFVIIHPNFEKGGYDADLRHILTVLEKQGFAKITQI